MAVETHKAQAIVSTPETPLPERVSTAPPLEIGTGMGYRGFTYAIVQMRLSKESKLASACLDTGCSATLIDRRFLKTQDPEFTP